MEQIAKALREAYKVLNAVQQDDNADLTDHQMAVEEAVGFVAEALDLVDSSDFIEIPK